MGRLGRAQPAGLARDVLGQNKGPLSRGLRLADGEGGMKARAARPNKELDSRACWTRSPRAAPVALLWGGGQGGSRGRFQLLLLPLPSQRAAPTG